MADNDTSPANQNLKYLDWQPEFEGALVESDPQKLRQRAEAAESAIFMRQQALVHSKDGHAEKQAIAGALSRLRLIQTEKLGYPDWVKKYGESGPE